MTTARRRVAGVELGGTKCVCILGTGPDDVEAQVKIPTTTPSETTRLIAEQLVRWQTAPGGIAALGIASFGPLDLRAHSQTRGHVTATAKPGWSGAEVLGPLSAALPGVPAAITTDVTGAALAEGRWGGAIGLTDYAYVTVGTGIGVGLIVGGRPVLGIHHPELGHIRIVRARGDAWQGCCPFHGDCLEGLASGPAISARAGMPAAEIPTDSPVWTTVAHALAQLLHTLVLTTGPQRILLGGGVLEARPDLLARVRPLLQDSLHGYVVADEVGPGIASYVTGPGLGLRAGPLGALAVALDALAEPSTGR